MARNKTQCLCCGLYDRSRKARFGMGLIHLECWTEHHSDPNEEWPADHRCKAEDDDEEDV